MSPKNSISPLSSLSLKTVANLLIHTLSDDEDKYNEIVRVYLQETTNEVLQDLLKFILNLDNLDASTRFNCLEVILREDVSRLDTGVFPHSYYDNILKVITDKGKGLRHLNLKGVWVRDRPLYKLLEATQNLKVLIIPHMADDLVLNALSTCERLSFLDISGECTFTKEGLESFRCDTLQLLDIGYYGKEELFHDISDSTDIIAGLIKNLPNLLVLKTYSFTGKALQKLYKESPNFKTKLNYIHDTNTCLDALDAIINTCPDLESLNFNSPEKDVIKGLKRMNKLHSIKISKADYGDLVHYLREAGNHVHVLKLSLVKENSLDVGEVCTVAPDIQKLECFKMSLLCLHPDTYFMSLQSLEILYCNISNTVLRYLLVNSPFLKRVVIGDIINMTDGDIFRLCAECDFVCLEELWFSCAKGLTATSVELLMGHCPNLKVLGQLSGWDVTANEMDYLRAVIVSTNTDLTLLPVGSLP